MSEEGKELEEERIRMEIMLGMTQDEGILCLLCLMPRCVCHITLNLTNINVKLTQPEGRKQRKKGSCQKLDRMLWTLTGRKTAALRRL